MEILMPPESSPHWRTQVISLTGAVAIALAAGWRVGVAGFDAVSVGGLVGVLAVVPLTVWAQRRAARREHESRRWRGEAERLARDVDARTEELAAAHQHLRAL